METFIPASSGSRGRRTRGRVALGLALTLVITGTTLARAWTATAASPAQEMQLIAAAAPTPAPGPDAADVSFRQALGLSTDITYIHQLKANKPAGAGGPGALFPYGVVLSTAEQQEVDFRVTTLEPSERTPEINAYVAAHQDSFGGLYLDQLAGGKVTFLFTADVATRQAELQKLFTAPLDRLVVRQVAHTDAELSAVQARLRDEMSYLNSLGLYSLWTDIINNRVVVSGPGANAAGLTAMLSRYGDLPVALEPGGATALPEGYLGAPAPPFKGGQDIETTAGMPASEQCSIGWNANNRYGNNVTTAGHCGPAPYPGFASGEGWAEGSFIGWNGPPSGPGVWVGNTSNNVLQNYNFTNAHSDAETIPYGGATSNLMLEGYGNQVPVRAAQGQNQDHVNDLVCQSGTEENGYICGLEQATGWQGSLTSESWMGRSGYSLEYQRLVNFYGIPGDSGGPVFGWLNSNHTSVIAVGSWVGKWVDSNGIGHGVFSQIFDVTSNLGVNVITCCS